jgi:general L-amino acid transport system permease protein
MSVADKPFVRTSILAAEPPPPGERGAVAWIRRNLLATPKDVILTILALALIAWAVPHLVNWLFIQAVWSGPDRTFCATTIQGGIQPDGWSGACWAFISAKYDQFIFGRYPLGERWRPAIVGILFILLLVPMLIPSAPRKGLNAILLFAVLPVLVDVLRPSQPAP